EQIKGIDVLLRALALLFFRHPDLRKEVCLLVVGGALDPGDDAPETEKIVELRRLVHEHRMEANVAFVGSRDQEQLALYYAAADLRAPGRRRLRVLRDDRLMDRERRNRRRLLRHHERAKGHARSGDESHADGEGARGRTARRWRGHRAQGIRVPRASGRRARANDGAPWRAMPG